MILLRKKSQSLLFEVFFPISNLGGNLWMVKSQSLLFEVFFPMLACRMYEEGKRRRNPFFLRSFFLCISAETVISGAYGSQSLLFEVFFPIEKVRGEIFEISTDVAIPSF